MRDDEKSNDRLFVAREQHTYAAYKISLTDAQLAELAPYCQCVLHRATDGERRGVCACCVGCVQSAFPGQTQIMATMKERQRQISNPA